MKKNTLKKILALVCAWAMLLTMASCGKKDEGSVPLVEGEVFTIAVCHTPDHYNPVLSQGGIAEEFFLLCYDPLWRMNAAGEPVPCLVEDWSLSSDSLTWTIRIKQGITFSDGTELTAEDVVFSYEMMSVYSQMYAGYFDGIRDIRCPDDYTVVISTEFVKGDLMQNPTPILPKKLWENYEFSPSGFDNTAMVGTGPFVYDVAASNEEQWVFRAREDYALGAAKVGSVVFSLYNTETGAARALAAGEVDASYGLTDVQLTTLESVPGVELVQAMLPQGECWALVFNTASPYFTELSMRQMVEYCADRERILTMTCGGAGEVGSSFVLPGVDYFARPAGIRGLDTDSALWTLQTAGYMDSDEDGVMESLEGETLRLTVCTSNGDSWAATAATILTGELMELGMDIDWERSDAPIRDVCAGEEDWDICFVSWEGSSNAVSAAATFAEDMEELTGWSSASFDHVLDQMRTATDEDTIRAMASQLQQIVYDECPCVVLAYNADVQSIRNDAWTGYEDTRSVSGGLFAIGCYDTYMNVAPVETTDE